MALILAFFVAALVMPQPVDGKPPLDVLKRAVESKEREFRDARTALTVARIRLALAEGEGKVAAKACRELLEEYEPRLKEVQALLKAGRLCSVEPLLEAEGSVAMARAWLAEAEGKTDDLAKELPKVIAYHEWKVAWVKKMREFGVISDAEMVEEMKEHEGELRSARDLLRTLQPKNR